MNEGERRQFLKRGALAAIAATASTIGGNVHAAEDKPGTSAKEGSTVAHGVTHALAGYIVKARYEDLPAGVRKEGTRTLPNWVGVAVGGSHHETIERAVAALDPFSGPGQAGLHSIGSVELPMTDTQLEVKFSDLIDGNLPKAQSSGGGTDVSTKRHSTNVQLSNAQRSIRLPIAAARPGTCRPVCRTKPVSCRAGWRSSCPVPYRRHHGDRLLAPLLSGRQICE